MWTLLPLRYTRHIFAGNGQSGGANGSFGCDGEDRTIDVPVGTAVFDAETGDFICEVTEDEQVIKLLAGGKGGWGNRHFATPTNRAPRYAQPGQMGIEKAVVLELKLLGDVGLVGFPNAGKSTLLSSISAAKPKIADYPFTTMEPSLGIVSYRGDKSFVMADIPGIIEGASEGKGLGLRFLRHIERNAVLLFMVPADSNDIKKDYEILLHELREFNPELEDKGRVLAVTKSDMLDDELRDAIAQELPTDLPVLFISSVTGQGLTELKDLLWREINSDENRIVGSITHRRLDPRFRVAEEDDFIFNPEPVEEDDFLTDEDYESEFWDEETSVNPD
jgi:GTP-binding protein